MLVPSPIIVAVCRVGRSWGMEMGCCNGGLFLRPVPTLAEWRGCFARVMCDLSIGDARGALNELRELRAAGLPGGWARATRICLRLLLGTFYRVWYASTTCKVTWASGGGEHLTCWVLGTPVGAETASRCTCNGEMHEEPVTEGPITHN